MLFRGEKEGRVTVNRRDAPVQRRRTLELGMSGHLSQSEVISTASSLSGPMYQRIPVTRVEVIVPTARQ